MRAKSLAAKAAIGFLLADPTKAALATFDFATLSGATGRFSYDTSVPLIETSAGSSVFVAEGGSSIRLDLAGQVLDYSGCTLSIDDSTELADVNSFNIGCSSPGGVFAPGYYSFGLNLLTLDQAIFGAQYPLDINLSPALSASLAGTAEGLILNEVLVSIDRAVDGPIPAIEPAAIGILGLGVLGMAAARRHRIQHPITAGDLETAA